MDLANFQQLHDIKGALQQRCIAVVGMSPKPHRDSHSVAVYMQQQGYEIIPVNPRETQILGLTCYPSIEAIPKPVGLVDVFRSADAVPEIARQTVAANIPYLWLQLGVISDEGAQIASAAGVRVIMDRCLKIDHARQPRA
jgi:predicted CoA-binding protein